MLAIGVSATIVFGCTFSLCCWPGKMCGSELPVSLSAYSVVGAAAYMGGATRMTLTTTVMVMETTGTLQLIVPIMLAVFVSKVRLHSSSFANVLSTSALSYDLLTTSLRLRSRLHLPGRTFSHPGWPTHFRSTHLRPVVCMASFEKLLSLTRCETMRLQLPICGFC